MTNNKKGFTLIELLVVIAIIGILSAIGLVSLNGAREKARDAQARSDLSTFRAALALYYDDHDSKYPGIAVRGTSTTDYSHLSDGTGANPAAGSVWIAGGPMITAYIAAMKSPSPTSAYAYGASNTADGATSPATNYIVGYKLEAAGGTNWYTVDNKGVVKDTKDAITVVPSCTADVVGPPFVPGTCTP